MMIAATGLALASVAYEWARGAHNGTRLTATTLWVDSLGVVLLALTAILLLFGYHLSLARAQYARHRTLAWPIVAIVVAHGIGASWHALTAPLEWLSLLLVALGAAVGSVAVLQSWTTLMRPVAHGATRRRQAVRHRLVGLAFGGAVLLHAALGVWHAVRV